MKAETPKTLGHVSLIGMGPGATDLITVCDVQLLGETEVVLHDAPVSPEVFQYYPQAVLITVGRRCGKRSAAQRFTNRQLVDLAIKYQHIVYLKGDDPMLFSRADEELQVLEQASIDYEIIPGIAAALAATSAIRQPSTKRGIARSVAFATQARAIDPGTPRPEGATPEPVARADLLVYYMGRDQAASIAADLITRGRAPSTPTWVAEAVTTPKRCSACFTLQQMVNDAVVEWANAERPDLLMIGDVLAVRVSAAASEPALDAYPYSLAA